MESKDKTLNEAPRTIRLNSNLIHGDALFRILFNSMLEEVIRNDEINEGSTTLRMIVDIIPRTNREIIDIFNATEDSRYKINEININKNKSNASIRLSIYTQIN